jgi:hypothetical protein
MFAYLEEIQKKTVHGLVRKAGVLGKLTHKTLALIRRVKFPGVSSPKFKSAASYQPKHFRDCLYYAEKPLYRPSSLVTLHYLPSKAHGFASKTIWKQERCPLSLSRSQEFLVAQVRRPQPSMVRSCKLMISFYCV